MNNKYDRFIDYTSLNQSDTDQSIARWVDNSPINPASYCVFGSMVESVALALQSKGEDSQITAVCGGFPTGHTYLEVKMLEVAMSIENGADEIDVVANIGAALRGDFELVGAEIRAIANEIGDDAILKVIIESGVLADNQLIYNTSLIAMEAGADFIKTATGRESVGATDDAVKAICQAIKAYKELTDKSIGIKISGGVKTIEQIEGFIEIVSQELGQQWITPALLRFGMSRPL